MVLWAYPRVSCQSVLIKNVELSMDECFVKKSKKLSAS